MINSIVAGIADAICQSFGEDYEIYTESVEQGLSEPCFFILCLSPRLGRVITERRELFGEFAVHFFPLQGSSREQLNRTALKLCECLEYITADGYLVNGTDIQTEISDGVLVVTVNYRIFQVVKETGNEMDSIESQESRVN